MPVLLLTTTGRRTGEARTTPLTYLRVDGRIVLIASYGGAGRHPAWYLNLDADPRVSVQRWRKRSDMTAHTLRGDDRDAVWSKVVRRAPIYAWYQRQTDRVIPVVELVGGHETFTESGTAVALDMLTRDELAAMARELDIAGRSKMNKAQLLDALRAQEAEVADAARGI
jgi:deazaflavin-dependent oxidoreductase (nitroreductase family)